MLSSSITTIKNLVIWEIRQRRLSTIWWIVGILAFMSLTMAVYPTFKDQGATLEQATSQLPESAKALFTDTADFFSPIGYLSSQIYYLMMPLLLSFLSIGLGASLIAREEQNHTIELLLSRQVSRFSLLTSKALAGASIVILVAVVSAVVGAIEVAIIGFDGVKALDIFYVTMVCATLALLFGAVSFLLTSIGRFGRGAAIGISTLLALAGYVISSLDKTVTWLQWPAKALPFHYYKPADIMSGQASVWPPIIYLLISVVMFVFAWIIFRRRDID